MGQQVIERLLGLGHKVTSLGRSPQPELKAKGVDVHKIDLADRQLVSNACKGMDAVFHVAAKAGVWGRKQDFVQANILGTRNILQGCKENKVPYLIHTSTPALSSMVSRSLDKTNPYHMDPTGFAITPGTKQSLNRKSYLPTVQMGSTPLHFGLI